VEKLITTLTGSWLEVGFEGYKMQSEQDYYDYWKNHFAIAYDHIDPAHIQISIGDYNGQPRQFGVKGNFPDPAQTGVGETTKYELVRFDYVQEGTGRSWDRVSHIPNLKIRNYEEVEGVAVFQLEDSKTLKIEFFPGKIKEQVTGFTNQARMYTR